MNQDGYAIREGLPMTLFIVADGMGGAAAGEVASRIAVETVDNVVQHAPASAWEEPADLLHDAVQTANREICRAADANATYHGMGTTVVALLVNSQAAVVAHSGDSRLYALQEERFVQVTEDHSLVAELFRKGQLTADEVHEHPHRNILTRSLGTAEFGYADVQPFSWTTGDVLLICTDGLSNLVEDTELEVAMRQAGQCVTADELERLVESLVSLALDRGGRDNVTVILIVGTEAGGVL